MRYIYMHKKSGRIVTAVHKNLVDARRHAAKYNLQLLKEESL